MRILLVAATFSEVAPLCRELNIPEVVEGNLAPFSLGNLEGNLLVTGAGMVPTAFYLGKELGNNYEAALNLGIAGSFFYDFGPGTVVHSTRETFSELGAEDDEHFIPFPELGIPGVFFVENNLPLKNPEIDKLPVVSGITVNTVHGNENSIARVFDTHFPFIETMEAGAFLFACQKFKIPSAIIRSVSNRVEKRNRDAWDIPLAVNNLAKTGIKIFNSWEGSS